MLSQAFHSFQWTVINKLDQDWNETQKQKNKKATREEMTKQNDKERKNKRKKKYCVYVYR